MQFCVLASGSKGNCTYISSGTTAILVDAGLSGIEIERRLASIGVGLQAIDAIILTHEHRDHIAAVPVLSRRTRLPVFANPHTFEAAGTNLDRLHSRREFDTGTAFTINGLEIHPFSISHDAADPVGFTVSDGAMTIGYCTDTGKVTRLMRHRLSGCNGLILESNHDVTMLMAGRYPPYLKQRIRSSIGHLANDEAGGFLQELRHDDLRHVVLAHLSESNNQPDLALNTVNAILGQPPAQPDEEQPFRVTVAVQHRPDSLVTLLRR